MKWFDQYNRLFRLYETIFDSNKERGRVIAMKKLCLITLIQRKEYQAPMIEEGGESEAPMVEEGEE